MTKPLVEKGVWPLGRRWEWMFRVEGEGLKVLVDAFGTTRTKLGAKPRVALHSYTWDCWRT